MKPKSEAISLLEPAVEESELFKELLLQKDPTSSFPTFNVVKPTPGFCLKTRNAEGKKVFINLCHSDGLPAPKDITESELEEILSRDECVVNYRVPLSLGDPRDELDKSGDICTAHDVVINDDFYKKVEKSTLFKNFVIQVAIEGLEDKCGVELNKKDWAILKNRKYLGTLSDITVRTSAKKPLITELGSGDTSTSSIPSQKPLIKEITKPPAPSKQLPAPKFQIVQDPPQGHPLHLVAQFQLPLVKYAKQIELDLGEDRIVLSVKPDKYFLDIFLPYMIEQDEAGAQFNTSQQVLTLTMTVKPLKT